MNTEIKEYWEKIHNIQNNIPTITQVGLTGSSGKEVWEELNIVNLIKKENTVLNIGIGTGRCTKDLVFAGMNTYVLDISESAINRVKDIVLGYWFAENIELLPNNKFDLAISHLVTQHMITEDLRKQIKFVLKSLKPNGIFAMQFAYLLSGNKGLDIDPTFNGQKYGSMCRTLIQMEEIISSVGGEIIWNKKTLEFPYYGSGWYSIHIMNRRKQ